MLFTRFLSFCLLAIALPAFATTLEKRGCTANNCLRALRASQRIAQASLDCSIFFDSSVVIVSTATTTTISVAATEITTTTTIYSIITPPAIKNKYKRGPEPMLPPAARHVPTAVAIIPRQESSSTDIELPQYATACRDASAYSSACSCIGVDQPTGTITVTDTTVSTVTGPASTIINTVTVPGEYAPNTHICPHTSLLIPGTACDPDQNYGIVYNGGGANPGPGVSGSDYNFSQLFNITDNASCCRRCFETVGCFTYDLVASYCRINFLVAGRSEIPTDTDLCPYGRLVEFTDPGNAFGLGPCNSYAGPAS
ncbi:hypothetical protein TWF718_009759 [Orbilia javanica]|uniref:Apple domain-containing protein n=1 Tax=Orbilia javanica TaxID=47235 RepID=A0AAN8RAS2_9PEZI